jgi:uncharacterized protein YjbJ (UPF0337 family)
MWRESCMATDVHIAQTTNKEVMMNNDQIKGEWDKLVGKAKRVWGELTDDDFLKAEGSTDKLYGTIQRRFGDTKEAIKGKLDKVHMS